MDNTETTTKPSALKSMLANIREIFTFRYYKEGFSGWDKHTYAWWAIGTLILIFTGLAHGISINVLLSFFGGWIGFTCTLAITSAKRINGLLGFISAILISIVALQAKNYSDIVMQMVYLVILDLNFMLFGDFWQKRSIKAMDTKGYKIGIAAFIIAFIALYLMDTQLFVSPRPVIDALAAAIGVTGGVLTVAKYHSQYWMWTAQGLMSVTLWGVTALQGDANWVLFATYVLFLGNDVIGLWFSPWAREARAQKKQA